MSNNCPICGCPIHRAKDTYARPTPEGRSHASRHHYVPERFFGRSKNRPGTQRERIFQACPWDHEGDSDLFCYDCHEEILHNPVFLPEDIQHFARLVAARQLSEAEKTSSKEKIAGRIKLLHEVIERGLDVLLKESGANDRTGQL